MVRYRQGKYRHHDVTLQEFFWKHYRDISVANLDAITYTLSERRSAFQWKCYAVTTRETLSSLDRAFSRPRKSAISAGALAFVFTGQGAQYPQMAKDLSSFPAFHNSLVESEAILKILGCEWSVKGKVATRMSVHTNRGESHVRRSRFENQ